MVDVSNYNTTPGSNSTINGINVAEGCNASGLNDAIRQMMADIRASANDGAWFNYGSGATNVANVYASATSTTVAGVDVTAAYHAGRRVRAVGATTGTIYGIVASSSFSTNTTVNYIWDSGSLANETLTVSLSQTPVTGNPNPGRLKFPAAQIASADPNTLDDYAEKDWTPTFSNLTVVGTPDAFTGTYVKIGRMVWYKMTFSASTSVATSPSTICNNFPFAAAYAYSNCVMASEDGTKTAIGLGAGNGSNIIMGTMAATQKIHVSGFLIAAT